MMLFPVSSIHGQTENSSDLIHYKLFFFFIVFRQFFRTTGRLRAAFLPTDLQQQGIKGMFTSNRCQQRTAVPKACGTSSTSD